MIGPVKITTPKIDASLVARGLSLKVPTIDISRYLDVPHPEVEIQRRAQWLRYAGIGALTVGAITMALVWSRALHARVASP